MVVATSTLNGEPQKRGAKCLRPIGNVLDTVLFLDAAPFVGLTMQPIKSRRENFCLVLARPFIAPPYLVLQQVSCKLPGDKLVVRHIFVEGTDHPVSPGPDRSVDIGLIAVGVGIPCHVEPFDRHSTFS